MRRGRPVSIGSFLRSAKCAQFFNADPTRAQYFSQITAAVQNQVSYDGSQSTITLFDAGAWTQKDIDKFTDVQFKKTSISCLMSSADTGVVAESQVQPPATDVYINTHMLNYVTQGMILHESLHNLTKKDDDDLKILLGVPLGGTATDNINGKLEQNGCAGTN